MRKALSLSLLAFALGCSESVPPGASAGPIDGGAPEVGGAPQNGGAPEAGGASQDGGAVFAWHEVTPCPVPRFEANGVVVDEELWVMGGFLSSMLDVTKRIDIYDPKSDHWRLGPELPGAETHAGVLSAGRDFILVGGFEGNVLNRTTTAGVWRWMADERVWKAGPDLPTPRAAVFAALSGTQLHAAGGLAPDGNTDSGEHLVWDLAGAPVWTAAPPLPNPRNHGGSAAVSGQFFAVSGRHGWDEVAGDDPALDAFVPATNGWSPRAPLPAARSEIGAATIAMSDGRLLIAGGSVTGKLPSADVLVYDPRQDLWSTLPSLPIPLKGVVAARIGSMLIVTTGSPTSTDPTDKTYVGCCL